MVLRKQGLLVLLTAVAALVLLALPAVAHSEPSGVAVDQGPGGLRAAGQLIVVYKNQSPPGESPSGPVSRTLASANDASGAKVAEELPDLDTQVLEFPEVRQTASAGAREESLGNIKAKLEKDPSVAAVYYNYVRTGFSAPNDPYFSRQYGMRKVGFPLAWTRMPRGVRVAVVDSGVDDGHPDLSGKVVAQYDFANNDPVAEDLNGHGTRNAGIIAANTNNGVGVAGGCPKCTIISAKALNRDLAGYDSNIAKAMDWSVGQGAKVINLSLGGLGEKSILRDAIDRAREKGVVVAAAGGNYGDSRPVYPAAYPEVISVAWTDSQNRPAYYSSHGYWQDVAAPGVDIYSTVPGGYDSRSGSSFAAPHVAALAGILLGQGRTRAQTMRRINMTATDLGAPGRDNYYGHGLINAARATR